MLKKIIFFSHKFTIKFQSLEMTWRKVSKYVTFLEYKHLVLGKNKVKRNEMKWKCVLLGHFSDIYIIINVGIYNHYLLPSPIQNCCYTRK